MGKPQLNMRPASQSGNVLMEFALVSAFSIPLLLGTFVVGTNLNRCIQTTEISRDAGHMYALGIDFSQTVNQNVIVRLAQGTGMTATGGTGVVILSKIIQVYQSDCDAAGLSASQCTNLNQTVFTHRITIGNSSLRASSFGTPTAAMDGQGNVQNYLTDTGARASNFTPLLALNAGQIAFVSEAYFSSADLNFQSYQAGSGTYAYSIF